MGPPGTGSPIDQAWMCVPLKSGGYVTGYPPTSGREVPDLMSWGHDMACPPRRADQGSMYTARLVRPRESTVRN